MKIRTAKRCRILVAAATANAAGAGTGFLAHALGLDPEVSAMIGTFVGGTVGEGLLQVVAAESSAEDVEVEGLEEADATEGAARACSAYGNEDSGEAEHAEAKGSTEGAERGVRRARHAGHQGYARCTRRRTAAAANVDQVGPARTAAAEPQHARHRHLHRSAQRFVTRVHGRTLRSAMQEGRHGAS
ncbi:hypothetical protein AS594_39920 [Streptomyces agglomeratus]|uniref:Uncharacterized protein n=1 Tax=Streptomyces agglomeratus TaxID=285458 RepID=A0A1E5NZC3_9ACTN|nr:hypothetical protein [Streptomyces agglomeratus]OEJ21675.1 hypothetical protein AS594_39920 [Streptomyces agglomeratus]